MQTGIHIINPSSEPAISQIEVGAIIAMANQIRMLTKTYELACQGLLTRLRDGVVVDPGMHTAELEEVNEGTSQTVRLILH
jgi:hypothetical protein